MQMSSFGWQITRNLDMTVQNIIQIYIVTNPQKHDMQAKPLKHKSHNHISKTNDKKLQLNKQDKSKNKPEA